MVLSSDVFRHVRYHEVAELLLQDEFYDMRYAEDFCEYYVLREERLYAEIYIMSWFFNLTEGACTKPISIHLEAYENSISLHMEIAPYEPFSGIKERYGEQFFNSYVDLRDALRSKMVFADGKGYYSAKLNGNANLSIAKFRIEANTYKEYFDAVLGLIAEVDRKMCHMK